MKFTNVDEVEVSEDDVLEAVRGSFNPDEVFSKEDLEDWASCNGWVHPSVSF